MKLDLSRKINFYWFSGTGNTLVVVRRMKEKFEKAGFRVNLKALERVNPAEIDCTGIIGLGFPVAMQGTYPLIWKFLGAMPECSGTPVFLVDTLMAYSGGIIGPAGRILRKKGYALAGAREIKMPHNFLVRKENSSSGNLKAEKGLNAADHYAADLIEGKAFWRDIPLFSDFMSLFSRVGIVWRLTRKAIPLRVDDDICTRCRLCEKLCPTDNWSLNVRDNRMEWGGNCNYCLRCFSYCPVNAIHYGKGEYVQYRALNASDFLGAEDDI